MCKILNNMVLTKFNSYGVGEYIILQKIILKYNDR